MLSRQAISNEFLLGSNAPSSTVSAPAPVPLQSPANTLQERPSHPPQFGIGSAGAQSNPAAGSFRRIASAARRNRNAPPYRPAPPPAATAFLPSVRAERASVERS